MTENTQVKVEKCADCGSLNTFSNDPEGDLCQQCFKNYSKKDTE